MRKTFSSPVGACSFIIVQYTRQSMVLRTAQLSYSSLPCILYLLLYIMGHLFKHTCSQHSFNYTFSCSLPDFSDEFQALLWSEDRTFWTRQNIEERWWHDVAKKGLGLAIPKRGASFLCDQYWRSCSLTQPAISSPFHSWSLSMVVPLSWCQFCM